MMKQREPLMKSAACYALAKVIEHYEVANPMVIQANPEVQDLISYSAKLMNHENNMVSRQATRVSEALHGKSGDSQPVEPYQKSS
jgi:hypothetical protein